VSGELLTDMPFQLLTEGALWMTEGVLRMTDEFVQIDNA